MTYPGPDSELGPSTGVVQDVPAGHGHHGGHGFLMLACCIPMIGIAMVLVATGVAGSGALIGALLCTVMLAAMMSAMPGGHGHK